MFRISLSWFGFLLIAAICNSALRADEQGRPNVLLMIVDDLGSADLGIQGALDVKTPNIDSIGTAGVQLTNAYVSAPVCSPSRAGLLSGRYQTHFGHELNHPQADRGPVGLPVQEQLWPVYFKQAGYATGHAGKWHLGNTQIPEFTPNARGFEESFHFPGQNKLPRPQLPYSHNGKSAQWDEKYVDLGIAGATSQFIAAHKSEPWFFYTAFLTPHEPMDLPEGVEDLHDEIAEQKRRKFVSAISLLDQAVGNVLQTLEKTGQAQRTLVIFLSDNGAPPGNGSSNAPFHGVKGTLWEGGIRSPFLIRWPQQIRAGQKFDTPVISLDLLATSLAAAGIPVADDRHLDGKNLLPLLTGKADQGPHDYLFWRYGDQWAVRHGKWKLVYAGNAKAVKSVRLHDLSQDSSEENDLSASHPEVVLQLQAAWNEWNRKNIPALWGN